MAPGGRAGLQANPVPMALLPLSYTQGCPLLFLEREGPAWKRKQQADVLGSRAPLGRSPGVWVLLGHWLVVSNWEEAAGTREGPAPRGFHHEQAVIHSLFIQFNSERLF